MDKYVQQMKDAGILDFIAYKTEAHKVKEFYYMIIQTRPLDMKQEIKTERN